MDLSAFVVEASEALFHTHKKILVLKRVDQDETFKLAEEKGPKN